jgi:predicted permease
VTATAFAALVLILLGFAVRRAGIIRREDGHVLIGFVLYLAAPALILQILLTQELEPALALVPIAAWAIHLILLGGMFLGARAASLDRRSTGSVMLAGAVGNTGFFGLPLIAASGDGFSLAAAVMYDTLGTGLITWTSTVAVASGFGGEGGGRREVFRALRSVLLLPPNWALVAGLALNLAGVRLDDMSEFVSQPIDLLAAAVLPVVMVYAGVMLEAHGLGRIWAEVTATSIVKLGIAAVVGVGIALAFSFDDDVFRTVVIMAAMPTAMMSLVLGTRYGVRSDILAGAVVVTTLLATVTLPVIRALIS